MTNRAERRRALFGFICLQVLLAATALAVELPAHGFCPSAVALFVCGPIALLCGLEWMHNKSGWSVAARHNRAYRWVVPLGCWLVIASVTFTQWPVRFAFLLSRPALERLADKVERGTVGTFPQHAGFISVQRAERGPSGSICLWTNGDIGFVRFAPLVTDQNIEVRAFWASDATLSGTWETGTWQFGVAD